MPRVFKPNHEAPDSYLFVKQNEVRDVNTNLPSDRTLFASNIPPCANEDSVKKLFSSCGSIENVHLNRKPTVASDENVSKFCKDSVGLNRFNFAYIVFENPSSLKKALQQNSHADKSVLFGEESSATVLTHLLKKCKAQVRDPENMKKVVNDFMVGYDKKIELEKQKAKEMDGVPDEEGWVTVTRHGKNAVTPRTDAANARLVEKHKKRSQKALLNFYASQMKESKMEQLAVLKKGFEAQKEKIEQMKLSRKFKPY